MSDAFHAWYSQDRPRAHRWADEAWSKGTEWAAGWPQADDREQSILVTSSGLPVATLEGMGGIVFLVSHSGVCIGGVNRTDRLMPDANEASTWSFVGAREWAREFSRSRHVCVYRDGSVGTPALDLGWLSLISLKPPGRTVLAGLLKGVNELIEGENFDQLSKVLAAVEMKDATPEALIALARYTSPARARLNAWRAFVREVREELSSRGVEVDRLMVGLPA